MKKALALLLTFAALGGMVFAQATVTGRVQSVFEFNKGGVTYSDNVRLNFNATTEDKNAGVRIRLNTSSDLFKEVAAFVVPAAGATVPKIAAVSYSYAYGFAKFFDGILTLTAGKLNHFDYYLGGNLASEIFCGNVSNEVMWGLGVKGALVQVKPIEGLSLGFKGIPMADRKTDITLGDFGFAASYAVPEILDIVLTSTFAEHQDFNKSTITAGVSVKALPDLTAIVGYKGIEQHGIFAIVGYSLLEKALYLEAATDLGFGKDAGGNVELTFLVDFGIEYSFMDMFRVGAYLTQEGKNTTTVGAEFDYAANKVNYNIGVNVGIDTSAGGDAVATWKIPVRMRYNF